MKLKKIVFAFAGSCALASASLMPVVNAGSRTLDIYFMDGNTWKLKLKDNTTLRLNKNGNVKCSFNVAAYSAFLGCATSKMGDDYYNDLYDAIRAEGLLR